MKKLSLLTVAALALLVVGGCEKEDAEKDPQVFDGLVAYYTFDDGTCNNTLGQARHGFLSGGEYITDSPNSEGQALQLHEGGSVSLGSNPVGSYGEHKNYKYSVSLWLKDFGEGVIYNTLYDGSHGGPTIFWQRNGVLGYRWGPNNGIAYYNLNLSELTKGAWVMLTIVTDNSDYSDSGARHYLYVNGRLIGSQKSGYDSYASSGTATIGGKLPNFGDGTLYPYRSEGYSCMPFKVDNLRLYGKAISESQVRRIYEYEIAKHLTSETNK